MWVLRGCHDMCVCVHVCPHYSMYPCAYVHVCDHAMVYVCVRVMVFVCVHVCAYAMACVWSREDNSVKSGLSTFT